MLKILEKKISLQALFLLFVLAEAACFAGTQLDKSKYITIDEIRPGMEAYCLTCYKGTKIEKFNLEVLSVVRDFGPNKDAIMVMGTDERFIHSGPVHGCSGSPVYIEGRLAGALAFGWDGCKDPLYGVTPIEEMLRTGSVQNSENLSEQRGFTFDFSKPIDFAEIQTQINSFLTSKQNTYGNFSNLISPLVTSGLPANVLEQLNTSVRPFGLMAVSGIGSSRKFDTKNKVKLVPGASLAVPLSTGDIKMAAMGTVTDVIDDKVYGFGHGWLGFGPIDLPMATGEIHTVVSHLFGSFKLGSALEVVGALTADESTAVYGRIGAKAKMIPLKITLDRYNDAEKRTYNCNIAVNKILTPGIVRACIGGAAFMLGKLPPDNMIEYKVTLGIDGAEPITFNNVSTGRGLDELIIESTGSVALVMNNPYKKTNITSMDFDIKILPKDISSYIWSVDLSDTTVKAGEQIKIEVILESVLTSKKKYQCTLQIPQDLEPGKYELIITGGYGYRDFIIKAAPYKFIPENMDSLIDVINNILQINRNKLYCLLVLPTSGISVEKAELPDLPPTKALILGNAKRTLKMSPYKHWVKKELSTGTITRDRKVIKITVEK